jgi:3-deoxy-D-arabino-heptulosonate 7-phosphate (DAHP) synthase
MKTIATLGLALGALAAMGYAEDISGKLVDAACHDKSQQNPADSKQKSDISACEATASTTSFAIQTSDGKVYKLDAAGNAKASTALKGNPANKNPMATVAGTTEGQTVKVDSISVR